MKDTNQILCDNSVHLILHLILLKCPLAGLNVTTKKPIENTLCKLPFGIVANSTTTIDSIQK